VTNYHVIASTYAGGGRTVQIKRGKLTYTGRIVRVSQVDDLAVVSLSQKLAVLPIATKRSAVGAPVLVLGSPLGLDGTVTSGIVSAYRTEDGSRVLQFSAPISPGNSGGPVLNDRGEVVGVSVSKYIGEGAEGLSFAIPAERLCPAIRIC
jgi:putative serine protease PepD